MVDELKKEFKRRVEEESLARITSCLNRLSEDQIWYAPNEHCNSVGNLVLHLEGNITQWIISGLGGKADERKRGEEFIPLQLIHRKELVDRITRTVQQAVQIVSSLDEGELPQIHTVQVFQETGISILVHVIEHTSYHTGQITLLTKMMLNESTGYYEHLNLEV